MTLAERLLALAAALDEARIPHAFGGAIALAYWTEEPRGTRDLDINAFIPATHPEPLLAALPGGVGVPAGAAEALRRDGQLRVFWDDVPVDLFLDYAPVHAAARAHVERVPFGGVTIGVLGPVELAVFKAMSDRTRDWADIEAMLAAQTLDVDEARALLAPMLSADDPRWARLDEAIARAAADAR